MPTMTTADGVELAYDTTGDGPALVLVHGITEDHRSWAPLVPALAEDHLVVAVDLRGHGRSGPAAAYDLVSMAGDLHEVVRELGAEAPLLVGHSLGGTVVSAYAARHACRGVVNVDQPLALAGFQDGLRQLEPLLRGDTASFEQAIAMVFDAMAGPLPDPERRRIEAVRRPRQQVVLAIWEPVLASTPEELDAFVEQLAGAIAAPYLSLHGIDPGPGYAGWLSSLVPGATVEVWPEHGHYPHLVDPDRFLDRLAAFEATLA